MTVPPNESYDWAAAQARLESAAVAAGEAPPAWMPKDEGEQIVGRLVEVNPSAHTAHGAVPVVTLEGPNGGRRSVWLIHAVLRRGFERANVQLGEVVLIRFLGKRQPEGGGNAWHDYAVVVDRPVGTEAGRVDWVAIARTHGDEVELAREDEARAAELEQQARDAAAPVTPPGSTPCERGEHDYVDDGTGNRSCSVCGEVDIPF